MNYPLLTSREWDDEAGLYFYRARYYDAQIGRFITEDPIGFDGGDVNFYAYVQNNPVNFIDPFGNKIPGGVKKWACGFAPRYCCYIDKLKCLNKLDLKTCPPQDIEKCEKKFLQCIAKAGKG